MISFELKVKEDGKDAEIIMERSYPGEKSGLLFSKVEKEFSNYQVEPLAENEPFLVMKLMAQLEDRPNQIASYSPTVCFKDEIREQLIEFIEQN